MNVTATAAHIEAEQHPPSMDVKPKAGRGASTAGRPWLVRHDDLARRRHTTAEGSLSTREVLDLVQALPVWISGNGQRDKRRRGTTVILDWLTSFPGDTWQDRWLAADADQGLDWIDQITASDRRQQITGRIEACMGLVCLMLLRVVLPSYGFLRRYRSHQLYDHVRAVRCPDRFTRLTELGQQHGMSGRAVADGLKALAKIVLHTGRDLDQLTDEDVFEYRAADLRADDGTSPPGTYAAWDLLRAAGILPDMQLLDALRGGQRSTAELVDRYPIKCRPVRDVLVRYLDERRPHVDYATLLQLVTYLVANFWVDIETHHAGIDSLHLPVEVAQAWRERTLVVTRKDGTTRPRIARFDLLIAVRGFYLDIQEWALQDAWWAAWAAPSPVRKGDTNGMHKDRKKTTAQMHHRVRERLPQLPLLVQTAEQHWSDQAELLQLADQTAAADTFQHADVTFRRIAATQRSQRRAITPAPVILIENTTTGERIDLRRSEDDAFWAWAVIEVLRHTGVRHEELLEITHLALVSYRLPDTGEVVPLLQIVPSKSNEERLLLVSPELASVLATIVSRLRERNDGSVPLIARYDPHERITGPALPHLFQRKFGWRTVAMSTETVRDLLDATLTRAGLRDTAGQPLHYTPHDFRRIFATEAVTGGLPVHIVARLLGHQNLTTTQAYMAVFQDDLVRAYRTFLDARRAIRPEAEYREPTEEEWREFQQHFETRKLELGTCGRPYGSPCRHEHACIRCPMLRIDPRQRGRLIEIIRNLTDRIAEARRNGWLGEVEGLKVSLEAAETKLTSLDRTRRPSVTPLGIPAPRSTLRRFQPTV